MKSDTHLDYAVFQLSPKRSRCELFVSSNGNTEKLASGLVKPFVTHLKVAEEQVALSLQSIKLEVEKRKNAEAWFTKGTLERFVRFVSTPEVLELVNTFDAEMSQLEAARKIYSQGVGGQPSLGGDGAGMAAAADETKKELLRAIDVRLIAVQQDLATAFARASAAGFNPDTVSELQQFSDRFGAYRLNEACSKFISLCQRRPELISPWRPGADDHVVRASWGSDMSIDDPNEDQVGSHVNSRPHQPPKKHQEQQLQPNATQTQHHIDQSKPATSQQPKPSSTIIQQRSQNENKEEEKKEEEVTESPPPIQTGQHVRRLSVQDRINLFENKQKETSSGGKPPSIGKSVELRRLSSDVSSAPAVVERAVLRRWSGASDMSIDLGNDKKDSSTDSPLSTPSSSSVSQGKSNPFQGLSGDKEQNEEKSLRDKVSSVKVEPKSDPGRVADSGLKDHREVQVQVGTGLGKEEDVGLKERINWRDQPGSQNSQYRGFTGKPEQIEVGDQVVTQEKKVNISLTGGERGGSEVQSRGFPERAGIVGVKTKPTSQAEGGISGDAVGDATSEGELKSKVEAQSKEQLMIQSRIRPQGHSRKLSGQFEGGFGPKPKETLYKGNEGDQFTPQPQWRSSTGEVEEVGKKDLGSSEKQISKVEDPGVQRMKFKKQVPVGPEQTKKSLGRRDESASVYASNKSALGKKVPESEESFSTPTMPVDQSQRIRQSRGNQELNDELKMKANELEKLFAEHKLRVPGDQFSSARRTKPADAQIEQETSSQYNKTAVVDASPAQMLDKNSASEPMGSLSNMSKFYTPPAKMADNQDYADTMTQNFSGISFSDDSRGKFYERYMQKRDAKLREEWGSKRAEKEAKLKAMQDILEQSRAEMKAKFSGSADRGDSVTTARRRAEKVRTFNFRSQREQHSISSFQSEEDEDLSEVPDQKYYGQDRSFNEASLVDGSSRISNTKKLLPNKNVSLSTPRTTAVAVPRSAAKVSNASSGRRRAQSENPLAQSVPNFSDLRKENTKPSFGAGKMSSRSQVRNYARSRSSNEEVALGKDDQPRRSQSLRKSSAGPVEFSDLSAVNSDGIVLAPLKFDKEQKNVEAKPFLRKGNGIGPGGGVNVAKFKASGSSETSKDDDESDEQTFEVDDSMDMSKEDEEDELENMVVENSADVENGRSRLSQESDKLDNSGSENGDSLRSLSQVDPTTVAELPAAVPIRFHAAASLQDSPGESPVSWNSRLHHPFSYPHETSDIDASLDSPIGSPASWNSHSLVQTEVDAARMRKKWGSAQKPFLVANATHNQSRRDVTKGFKRLLKFGRKSRGTDSLMDWISATTSEGDDDTEDGRDPANRSSEDLRKSRMGFSQGHPSDDGFNESELFSDQAQSLHSSIPAPPANFKLREDHMSGSSIKAPRSFFSLSTFRSKGSDSKPR